MISINELNQMAPTTNEFEAYQEGEYNFEIVNVHQDDHHSYRGDIIGARISVKFRFTSGAHKGRLLTVNYSIGHPNAREIAVRGLTELYRGATYGVKIENQDQSIADVLTNREVHATLQYDKTGKYPELRYVGPVKAVTETPRIETAMADIPWGDDNTNTNDMY